MAFFVLYFRQDFQVEKARLGMPQDSHIVKSQVAGCPYATPDLEFLICQNKIGRSLG